MKKIIVLILILIISFQLPGQKISKEQHQKLNKALRLISQFHVDSIQESRLIQSAIIGMLESLDPHSRYFSAKTVKAFENLYAGSMEGVGIQFYIIKDTVVVQSVTGTSAKTVGILPTDKIIQIEDSIVSGVGVNRDEVSRKLRGKQATFVNLKIKRGNQKELLDFRVIREKIPLNTVDAFYMVTNKIGYVKINFFSTKTHQEFINALKKMKNQGMESLVVDLQGNRGGYMPTATTLVDEFLTKNKLIYYSKADKIPKRYLKRYKSTTYGNFKKGGLVILVDQYSASASEMLAGAIQDWDRGVIVGRRTYGKGLMQSEYKFFDGSSIRITKARYHLPTGRCIQKSYKEGVKKYREDLNNRLKNGELMHKDSVHFSDSLKYSTLLSRRTVYGGGGIMPDIFVPLDTIYFSSYYQKNVVNEIIKTKTIEYLIDSIFMLKRKYNSLNDFQCFVVPKTLLNNIIEEITKGNKEFTREEYQHSEERLKIEIKALIAKSLWGDTAYFQIINKENKSLQKAIEILEDEKKYNSILSSKTTNK